MHALRGFLEKSDGIAEILINILIIFAKKEKSY